MRMSLSVFVSALFAPWLQAAEVPESRLKSAFERAGENAGELRTALGKLPPEQTEGLAFLIEHMPERDLVSLSAEYLVENIAKAYAARAAVPWGKEIPEELFLNDVLPYASINERRDDWRGDFYKRFPPWNLRVDYVQAENVTERYTGKIGRRVFIQLFDKPGGKRVAADVEVWSGGKKIAGGRTRDAVNDSNDMLGFPLKGGVEYELRCPLPPGEVLIRKFTPSGKDDEQIEFYLAE